MKHLLFVALAAAAFAMPAFAEDTPDSMRQSAIESCKASGASKGEDPAKTETQCTCIVDAVITAMPGDDGVKMLKIMMADANTPADVAKALGISEADAKAFMDANQAKVMDAVGACLK